MDMTSQRKPNIAPKSIKHLIKHFESIEEAEDINLAKTRTNSNYNRANKNITFLECEEKTVTGINSEVSRNIEEPLHYEIVENNNISQNQSKYNVLQQNGEINPYQNIFGFPLSTADDFCLEAINTCQENVLFKLRFDREALALESFAETGKDINLPKEQNMIIKELMKTEETYLKNMKHIIENYLQYFRDNDISSNVEKLFGNIEEIYRETKNIYSCMEKYTSVDDIAKVFLDNVSIFECYTKYLRNKMKFQQYPNTELEYLIKQRQIQLKETTTCESYLANPAQRPGRYRLLLENLNKAIKKNNESSKLLEEAIILIDSKMSEANTIMAIDSIQNCPFDSDNLGSFLMKDKFDIKGKYQNFVFLFENYVIFCKDIEDNPNLYDYIDNIEMEKLMLAETNSGFQLGRYKKSKDYDEESRYEFDVETHLMVIKTKWVDEITRLLWNQLQYYKTQQDASIHQADISEDPVNDVQPHEDLTSKTEDNLYENIVGREEASLYEVYSTRSHTFFDKDDIPRIEIFRSNSFEKRDACAESIPETITAELIKTEGEYLSEMKYIIDTKTHFETTCDPLYSQILLENIKNIFSRTEIFYLELLELDSYSEESVVKTFLNNARVLDFYTEYMRNKAKSYRFSKSKTNSKVKDKQIGGTDQYSIDSYLLDPVLIRPAKYKTWLEKLQREQAKIEQSLDVIDEAVKLINEKITEANTLMSIDSIQGSDCSLEKTGPFIKKGMFKLKRKHASVVFLFRRVIVICAEDNIRPDTYVYIDSIEMTNLAVTNKHNTLSFELTDSYKSTTGKEKNGASFILEAATKNIKEKWLNDIQTLVWKRVNTQNSFMGS